MPPSLQSRPGLRGAKYVKGGRNLQMTKSSKLQSEGKNITFFEGTNKPIERFEVC